MASHLLVLQHQENCPPGWFGEWLTAAGVDLEVRKLHEGATVPAALGPWNGLLVLGGRMGANDDQTVPWLSPVRSLIASVVTSGAPFLGICLGHQLGAVALGGTVRPNPRGRARGITPVRTTAAAAHDPLFGVVVAGVLAVQWNNDVVVNPSPGMRVLATAPDGTVQAARLGPAAWGVQFHPEASPGIFRGWTVENPDLDLTALPGLDLEATVSAVQAQEDALRRAWEPLARRFAAILGGRAVQSTA